MPVVAGIPTSIELTKNTDFVVSVSEVQDEVTGQLIADAVITAELQDTRGVAVPGASAVLAYLGSGGNYSGVIPAAGLATLQAGAYYTFILTLVSGTIRRVIRIPAVCTE